MNKHVILAALTLMLSLSAAHAESDELRGAGSTFAAGAYTSWGFIYAKEKGVSVAYQATGSGDGIKQIQARSVDFGASDYALSAEDLKKNGLVQIPTLVGGVVPVLNIPGIRAGQLRLTGTVLAAIYSGRISSWNDPRIQALNTDIKLPNLAIVRVVRAEASGTTAGFTEYLSKVDPEWASRTGSGLQVSWIRDVVQVKGNDGVAKTVHDEAGAIGYVSANSLSKNHLAYPLLQNKSRNFVAPTNDALLAAVKASSAVRDGEKLSYVDMAAPDAWPITDATYILLDRTPKNPERATRMLRFIYWSFLRGDAMASETGYVPLPSIVQARAVGSLRQIHGAQDTPLDFMGSAAGRTAPVAASAGMLAAL